MKNNIKKLKGSMHHFSKEEIENLEERQRANIINSLSGYKSPLLLGSVNPQTKTENLAIFSNVFHIGSSPALLGVFFRPAPEGTQRHTLENILSAQSFTINFINEAIIKEAHQTSARYSKSQSEFDQTGLTPLYSDDFTAPRVKESPLSIEMKLEEHIQVKTNKTSIIIASIQNIYSQSDLITNHTLELENHSPIAVKGLDTYFKINKTHRLSYAKPNKDIQNV